MGRNFGVNKDLPEMSFTAGFWAGASVATISCGLLILIGLYVIGLIW